MYVPKHTHKLLNLYNVTYVFRAVHLVLDEQLVCFSLVKTGSPTASTPWFPIALCRVEAS